MNDTIEALFEDFLDEKQTGELAEELRRISSMLDVQIKAGAVTHNAVADYECAAMRLGFYAGYAAALEAGKIA